jgi:hypothetical protein
MKWGCLLRDHCTRCLVKCGVVWVRCLWLKLQCCVLCFGVEVRALCDYPEASMLHHTSPVTINSVLHAVHGCL